MIIKKPNPVLSLSIISSEFESETMMSCLCHCFVLLFLLLSEIHLVLVRGQQSYVNNHQLDCYNGRFNYTTKGYVCNGVQSSCQSYLTFRSTAVYDSAAAISYLLGVENIAPQIASINNISSDITRIPPDTLVIIPVNCSCNGGKYYQYNASYTLKDKTETYFTVANLTYQGLSTCQALMDQNPYESHNLKVGYHILVPLRCACPTPNQTADGFKYLLTYIVETGNTLSSIAESFNVDKVQRLFYGNNLTSTLIYPFTPLLVPLKSEPTSISFSPPPPPAAQSPQTPAVSVDNSNSSNKWVFVGAGIGAALLILVALSGLSFWCLRRRRHHEPKPDSSTAQKIVSGSATDYSAPPETKSWSISPQGVRYAIDSLTVYKFADLEAATGYFIEENRIKGSVYKGSFKGDAAAVKVMKGDVTSEINILKKINHSSVIRLSGFCVHDSNTYLVYEFAENGSLSDWLHLNKHQESTPAPLWWTQRIQIAHGVADALNYLHHYVNPPYIHKNLKTSNILLDASFRAKVANFGLARTVSNGDEGGLQLTRHVIGTHGYMAPEYIENGVITSKLDVYAFGVVILELLSGKEAAAADDLLSLVINRVLEGENVKNKLQEFMDPNLKNEYPLDLAFSLAQLAKNCVARDLNARPDMPEILMMMSKILSSSLDWDPSDELGRSKSLSS